MNDPDDPGGATNHGVTLGTMRELQLDLTRDGKVDARDVKALDPAKAAEIYVRHYFREPKLDLLAGAAAAQRLRHAGERRRQRRADPAAADWRPSACR